MGLARMMIHLILGMPVFMSSDTNKSSSVIYRKRSSFPLFALLSLTSNSILDSQDSYGLCFVFPSFLPSFATCRVLSNFAFSFSIISVLTGVTTLYNNGLNFGGPVSVVYGWFIASAFTMLVGLSMAEICSSYPTSGGLYYWSAKLAGPGWAPFASWITGW